MSVVLLPCLAPALLLTPTVRGPAAPVSRHAHVVAVDAATMEAASKALDFSDPTTQAAVGAAAAILFGGAFIANSKNESPPPPASPPPASPAPAPTPPVVKEWPALGGSGAFHPMRGPWPKTPTREQWNPPPGWEPPRKPVLSWYDKGLRLEPPAPAPAPAAPATTPPSPPSLASMWDNFVSSLSVSSSSTAASNAPKVWPAVGGSGAAHPMAGPWPKPPAREQWIPPPGWQPPSRPAAAPSPVAAAGVASWFDTGKRL